MRAWRFKVNLRLFQDQAQWDGISPATLLKLEALSPESVGTR